MRTMTLPDVCAHAAGHPLKMLGQGFAAWAFGLKMAGAVLKGFQPPENALARTRRGPVIIELR